MSQLKMVECYKLSCRAHLSIQPSHIPCGLLSEHVCDSPVITNLRRVQSWRRGHWDFIPAVFLFQSAGISPGRLKIHSVVSVLLPPQLDRLLEVFLLSIGRARWPRSPRGKENNTPAPLKIPGALSMWWIRLQQICVPASNWVILDFISPPHWVWSWEQLQQLINRSLFINKFFIAEADAASLYQSILNPSSTAWAPGRAQYPQHDLCSEDKTLGNVLFLRISVLLDSSQIIPRTAIVRATDLSGWECQQLQSLCELAAAGQMIRS